jgi:LacI family gluconate utilization system Gnt-I transcriptional repressor
MMKRREGFRKGLLEAGITPEIEVLLPEPTTVDMGAQLLRRVLEQHPECDSVFCCNDDLALGALFECQRQGISVPREMAIAGFNDLLGSCATPSITTVVTPRYDIGYKSADAGAPAQGRRHPQGAARSRLRAGGTREYLRPHSRSDLHPPHPWTNRRQ